MHIYRADVSRLDEKKLVDFNLVGKCGLYCDACVIYRAYKDGGTYLKRVAEHFKIPPEKVR